MSEEEKTMEPVAMELVIAVQDLIFVLKLGMGMVASLCIIRVYVLLSQL